STIETIRRRWEGALPPQVVLGIGDDAAVLRPAAGRRLLVSTDLLTEGVHFDERVPPRALGRKALLVNISDIAAMGGSPRAFLSALALPPETETRFVEELYTGFEEVSRTYHVPLVGGDLSASPAGISLCVTILGEARRVVERRGAVSGDLVCVTGTLGDAALGRRKMLEAEAGASPLRENPDLAFLWERHISPTPRVETGILLAEEGVASAMIDISDGLLGDLTHILTESGVAARIFRERIPRSPAYHRLCGGDDHEALSGGEDYELLFTVPAQRQTRLDTIARRTRTSITVIGQIEPGEGIRLVDAEGRESRVTPVGYRHFG
ncbi:MAG: thiamine-phosphate kinase, partial [Deltaproteobacteria bacterium]